MKVRSPTLVGVSQMSVVQVPLVEWCLGTVVHSKRSVVEVINNTHDLNYLGNTIQKGDCRRGTQSSDSQKIYGAGRGQTKEK